MQLIYNSDSFAVMHFVTEVDDGPNPGAPEMHRGGFEIVDKLARREIYLHGAVAESFQRGVKALVVQGPDPQALEDYIGSYTVLAQQPVSLH